MADAKEMKIEITCMPRDLITRVLIPFLTGPEHLRFARTCRSMSEDAGRLPFRKRLLLAPSSRLSHLVRLTAMEVEQFGEFCSSQAATVTHLCFSDNNFGDDWLSHLVSLPLQYLDITSIKNDMAITNSGLAHLSKLTSLTFLNLDGCFCITNAGLLHLRRLPLRHLDLRWCKNITSTGLANVADIVSLHYLNLSNNHITDIGLMHISHLPLHYLNLSGCSSITIAGLVHISSLPLNYLNLSGCSRITSACLEHISSLPLQHLNLSGCRRITNAGLEHIRNLPLRHLNLSGCNKTMDRGLEQLTSMALCHIGELPAFTNS